MSFKSLLFTLFGVENCTLTLEEVFEGALEEEGGGGEEDGEDGEDGGSFEELLILHGNGCMLSEKG